MGNYVSNRLATEDALDLSNGSMSVLVSALVLAGSSLAATEWEMRVVAWIARRDQGVFGLGMVGFDLVDIPWTTAWEDERAFFLRTIDLARTRFRFQDLDYDPPFVGAQLEALRALVAQMSAEVAAASVGVFEDAGLPVPRCEAHDVIAHAFGCALCGDDVPPVKRAL